MKRTMKKGKAIVVLLIMVLILGGLSYITMFGVGAEKIGSASHITLGLDLKGGVSITYQVVGDEVPSDEDMNDTIYKLQQRVDNYSTESAVYKEGTDRITVEIPGATDANEILAELGQPGSLYFIAETDSEGNLNYSLDYTTGKYVLSDGVTIDSLMENGSIVLTGSDVEYADAATQQDQQMGNIEYIVQLKMNEEGTQKFADATTKAYEAGEKIAIYYDGEIVSAPNVQNAILDGSAQISGQNTFEEAEQLASTIRIGGLKLELEELRSSVVGAQLGDEAISTSLKAGVIGLAIVILFMICVYWIPGLVAGIALVFYTVLELILLEQFNVTLTLPGIAGIILSIGMAVDANVIIYARVREEIAAGKSVRSAIDTGFQKATSAIVDGNVTTLIAAFVLYFLGTGTIKGFAETLAIGIVLSLFSALVISRILMNVFYSLGIRDAKFYGKTRESKTIDFLKNRKIFFTASCAVIIAGIVLMAVNGAKGDALNYSLEFKGGTATSVTFNEELDMKTLDTEVRAEVEEIIGSSVQITKTEGTSEVTIKSNTLDNDTRSALEALLEENYGVAEEAIQMETISATVSSEMRADAIIAVIVAAICMLIYIWVRFRDVRFASSAVIALLHDVLVVLAFYAVAKVSVGNTFIACMLTIVGYSINATIVIFDRIRENMVGVKTSEQIAEVVNSSITQTLTRSIYTSFTTFVMVVVLYILGVTSIREFALPLMVGIICGAYSSVCITGALWYVMKRKGVEQK